MDSGTADRRLGDAGVTSVQFVLASVLSLLVFMAMANLVVVQYARGSLRSALDQGVRAGAVHRSEAVCEERIARVLEDLLAGEVSDGLGFSCSISAGLMTAQASVVVESWTLLSGDFDIDLKADAVMEPDGT